MSTAAAWERRAWWPARYGSVDESPSADISRSEHLPGAWMPVPWPVKENWIGSLNVIQSLTRSPKAEKHASA